MFQPKRRSIYYTMGRRFLFEDREDERLGSCDIGSVGVVIELAERILKKATLQEEWPSRSMACFVDMRS